MVTMRVSVEGQILSFDAKSNVTGARIFLNLWYVVVARQDYLLIERAGK